MPIRTVQILRSPNGKHIAVLQRKAKTILARERHNDTIYQQELK